tara:strand:- start:22796 stop:23188 length:393 start_codon:yes stop_codon:yes gene_type:complete
MFNVVKILYLILFYLIYRITDLVLLAVMLIQVGLNIFSGEPSESIKMFGKSLGAYLQQISEFLSYASEEKPFPFSDWPELGAAQSESLKSATDLDVQNEISAEITDKADVNTDSKDNGKNDTEATSASNK